MIHRSNDDDKAKKYNKSEICESTYAIKGKEQFSKNEFNNPKDVKTGTQSYETNTSTYNFEGKNTKFNKLEHNNKIEPVHRKAKVVSKETVP